MKRTCYLYCILFLSFLLGVHNGYIALWEGDNPEPKQVFPYAVTMLPEADRETLERGIVIRDRAQLAKCLEDFLS